MNDVFSLLSVIESCQKIEGRKKLQKLVYILKEGGGPFHYSYSFHLYGPFSADLKQDIDTLVKEGLVLEREVDCGEGGKAFTYQINASNPASSEIQKRLPKLAENLRRDAEALNKEAAAVLEAASTVVYLRRHQLQAGDERQRFRALKPNLEQVFDAAKQLADRYCPAPEPAARS